MRCRAAMTREPDIFRFAPTIQVRESIERPDVVVREDILVRARTAYEACVALRGACDGVTADQADGAARREKT